MKWIAVAIVIAALIVAATLIYLDRTRVTCERVQLTPGLPEQTVCRDGTGKLVIP